MRSIWKGHIRFSLVTIPILVYNALDTEKFISFNLLHKEDHGPIGYDKRCKKCQKVVSSEDIVKGFKYEPDQYVMVEKEDLEKITLKSTRIIEIAGFIDPWEVPTLWYEAPYYAGPDGPVAVKAYALLVAALKKTGKRGIGKVVLHDREDVVLIGPYEQALVLYKLRHPQEIRKVQDIPLADELPVDEAGLKLALSLIESMATSLDRIDLADRYHEALRAIIDAKIAGKEIVTVEEEEKPVVDIMTALKLSIEKARSQKKPVAKTLSKSVRKRVWGGR